MPAKDLPNQSGSADPKNGSADSQKADGDSDLLSKPLEGDLKNLNNVPVESGEEIMHLN